MVLRTLLRGTDELPSRPVASCRRGSSQRAALALCLRTVLM